MKNFDILLTKVRLNEVPELNDETNTAVKTLIQSFPINTEQQLISMEEWLSNSADNIHALVCTKLPYIFFKTLFYIIKIIL